MKSATFSKKYSFSQQEIDKARRDWNIKDSEPDSVVIEQLGAAAMNDEIFKGKLLVQDFNIECNE